MSHRRPSGTALPVATCTFAIPPFVARPPHPSDEPTVEPGGHGERFLAALASRVALLGVVALLLYWLA